MKNYSRLYRKADPFDFLGVPYQEEIMHINKPKSFDSAISDKDFLSPDSAEDAVSLKEVDPMLIDKQIQKVFFDLYGTNLDREAITEIINNLPKEVPNETEAFDLLLMKTFRSLQIYEWVDTQADEDVLTPQDFASELEQMVDSGEIDDIDDQELDDVGHDLDQLADTTDDETPQEPYDRAKATKSVNELLRRARNIRTQRDDMYGDYADYSTRRSLADIASNPLNRTYGTEEGIFEICTDLTRDPNCEGFDVGLPKTQGSIRSKHDAFMAAGGGSFNGSWAGNITNFGGGEFPTINCDNIT